MLSTKEAAEYCGFKLSYFRKLMMRRTIPMYKPSGKLCFFKQEDLDSFLTGVRIPSQEEVDAKASRYLIERKPYSFLRSDRLCERNDNSFTAH